MPARSSDGQKLAVIIGFEEGKEAAEIAAEQQVNRSYAYRQQQLFRQGGLDNLLAKPIGLPGRKRSMTADMVDALLEHLELYPTAYLEEMAYFIYDQFGIWPHKSTISRRLNEATIS
ncbi:MAG: hypothetical protein M1829_002591 [Trizodia sp. TS-e1964]|nr:MAG: hypothetical protein M1829_002591 [Trizodia sp. TS-e1964]